MIEILNLVLYVSLCAVLCESARILTVVPIPSISHQVVFRPLTQELARRGHQVTVITTDPAFPKGQAPENLTEIDLHESYTLWRSIVLKAAVTSGNSNDLLIQMKTMMPVVSEVFETQMFSEQVQSLLKSKPKFDLLILEAAMRHALVFSHIFKDIPVVLLSSFGGLPKNFDAVGAPNRPPLLYPTPFRQRLNNLTLWEKIYELYMHYSIEHILDSSASADDLLLKRIAGEDTPSMAELENNVDLLMLNYHPMWDSNRPVPPSVVYVGGIHQKPSKDLPDQDLKSYLDSSKHGVIYISYGTNVSPSQLPPEKIQILTRAFSKLPYDVLWKWDKDVLPGQSSNIRISKWLPQSDLLKHPKIKLFITQGGLQSTDEAITAGVPLIGMPMLGDQWFNVEQYVRHQIGIRLDMEHITEETFLNGVNTVIDDKSYRQNIARLRALMYDQPESALDRAVWWTEHVLRHGGRHLRAPAANLSWAEYLDADLLLVLAAAAVAVIAVVLTSLWLLIGLLRSFQSSQRVKAKLH